MPRRSSESDLGETKKKGPKVRFWDLLVAGGLTVVAVRAFQRAFGIGEDNEDDEDDLEEQYLEEASDLGRLDAPKTRLEKVSDLDDRIEIIRELIVKGRKHPSIQEFAVQSVSGRCGDDWCAGERAYDDEVIALFKAARSRVRYVRDTIDADTYRAPHRTLALGGGDCDDMSAFLSASLGAIGYPTKLRVVETVGAGDWSHIYVLVGIPPERPSRWVALDLSEPHPAGWQVPEEQVVRFKDFEVPD